MSSIHSTAVVSSRATLGKGVKIGPFCVVEDQVVIGDRCRMASHVVIKSGVTLGPENEIAEGVVLGGKPQHLAAPSQPGALVIGRRNTIREYATIHLALGENDPTVIGDHNLIMANVHVAHDCCLGNNTILANNVILAGHVTIGDFAYLSGAVAVHQFCRIGQHAIVGGQAHIKRDVPPYVTVDGLTSCIVGLNLIGLKRRDFTADQIAQLKEAYRVIYRSGFKWVEVLKQLEQRFTAGPAARFHPFLSDSSRGFLSERRSPRAASLKLFQPDSAQPNQKAA